MKLRICLISREFPPDTGWGGIGAYTFQSARGLQKFGHQVEVISLASPSTNNSPEIPFTQDVEGITVHRVPWTDNLSELNLFLISAPTSHYVLKSGIALWKRFLELHLENPFDVVETPEHLAAAIFHSGTAVLPLLVTLHTPHFKFVEENIHQVRPNFDNLLIGMLEKMSILQADVVASPSLDLASFVSEQTGLALEEIQIVRNPVDTSVFCPQGKRVFDNGDKIRVLFVGRLEPRKGIQTIIEAIPEVRRVVPNVEFILVGSDTQTGPNGTSMRQTLEMDLKKQNCLEFVRFIPHVDLMDMPAYYRSADLCVIPSIYDNAPYTCIEALSCGKPVIVSRSGGTKEYVEENVTGLTVPANDAKALSTAIITLAQDKDKRISFGHSARKYAEINLALDQFAYKKVDLYHEAIARHKKNSQHSLYRLESKRSLQDSIEILCSFDQMIFDVLSQQSIEFRIKTWLRLLKKRPKLALATVFKNTLEKMAKLVGQKPENFLFYLKLKNSIEQKYSPPFELARSFVQLTVNDRQSVLPEQSPIDSYDSRLDRSQFGR